MFTNLFKRLLTSANVHLLFWAYKLMMCLGKLSVQTESIVKCNCNYFNCTVKGHICVCVCVWLCVCVCFSLLQQQNKPQREVPLATKVLKQEQTKVRMVIIWVWRQRPKTPITKRTHTRKQLATCLANTLKAESRTHTHTHKHKSTHNWHTTILMQHTFGGLMLEMTTKASGWVGRKGGWVAVAHLPPPPFFFLQRDYLSLFVLRLVTFTVCFRCDLAHLTPWVAFGTLVADLLKPNRGIWARNTSVIPTISHLRSLTALLLFLYVCMSEFSSTFFFFFAAAATNFYVFTFYFCSLFWLT